MIKKKVKKVTYQIWEECRDKGCDGVVNTSIGIQRFADKYAGVCGTCGREDARMKVASPRIVEEYEEVLE